MSPSRQNVFSSDIDIELFFIIIYAIITNFRKINKVTYIPESCYQSKALIGIPLQRILEKF